MTVRTNDGRTTASRRPGTLTLALAQVTVEAGNRAGNLARAEAAVAEASERGADIVVLPEAMDLGWAYPFAGMHAGAVPGGAGVGAFQQMAERHHVWVCAGLNEAGPGDSLHCYNAAVLIDRGGSIRLQHRKIHELDFARAIYATGDRLSVCDTEFGRIGVMICADAFVRDRVISRCLGHMGAQLLLSPCAWAVPPEHDNAADPYGQLWLDSYGPVAREFGMWIAGVSNVGLITAGGWSGRRCIGCSMLVGPDGTPHLRAPYGEHAEALLLADIALG